MKTIATPTLLGTLLLAGCGGSSTGTAPMMGSDCPAGSFCAVSADFTETLNAAGFGTSEQASDPDAITYTTAAQLPPPGTANYDGHIAISFDDRGDDGEVLLGAVDIDVTFSDTDPSFSGVADGFVSQAAGKYSGELQLTNGRVLLGADDFLTGVNDTLGNGVRVGPDGANDEDVNGLVGDLTGTLTSASNVESDIDGNLAAVFNGPNADIVGLAIGSAETNDTTEDFIGFIVAGD